MFSPILDTIGDWNPQLLRELRGHLKPIKMGLAIALSLIAQVVFLLIVLGQLPGSIDPSHLNVTTYPTLQMDYNPTGPITISHLVYNYPLEKHPHYDISANGLEQFTHQVREGDRILKIDGKPMDWDESELNPQTSKQDFYETTLDRPFASEIKKLKAISTAWQAAQTLRQQVPGTTVSFTLERQGMTEPLEVTLPRIVESTSTSPYCLHLKDWQPTDTGRDQRYNACYADVGEQSYKIDWMQWYRNAFWGLSIATFFPLIILGTYTLINNLLKEERDGTLNFIRLSPQSAGEILLGKMLGVPVLIYLAVALTLPLSLFYGLSGGLDWGMLLGFYGATGAIAFLTFSLALLIGMVNMSLGMVQAWLGAGAIFSVQLLCLQASINAHAGKGSALGWALMFTPFSVFRGINGHPFVNNYATEGGLFQWFGIPMVWGVMVVLLLVNSLVMGRWVWHALERRFFNPTSTILSKAQSYGLTLVVNVAAMGFSWQSSLYGTNASDPYNTVYPVATEGKVYAPDSTWLQDHLLFLLLINLALWATTVTALAPHRQSLHDWARYRHLLPTPTSIPAKGTSALLPRRSLWAELIWGEKSPIVVAIALNLLIGAVCILLWITYQTVLSSGSVGLLSLSLIVELQHTDALGWLTITFMTLLSTTNILLIGATIAQMIFLKRENHGLPTALLILIGLLLGPPIGLGLTGFVPALHPVVWFTLCPWVSIHEPIAFVSGGMLGLFSQWAVLGSLNWWLFHWVNKIGASESKTLLSGSTIVG